MRVLAIGCHPDDLEIACGGTLRKYVEQGAEVVMCHVANGNLGHVEIEPDPLRAVRIQEAGQSGAVLGAREVISLDVGDLLPNRHDQRVIDQVADTVRYVKPDVIITHNPDDYMQDHMEVSRLATNGSFCSGLTHRPRVYDAFSSFVPVFFMDTLAGVGFQPTHYVDISGQIDRKLEALRCHQSQIKWMLDHDGIDFLDMVRTCSRYRGYQCGAAYAEGFRPYMAYLRVSAKALLP